MTDAYAVVRPNGSFRKVRIEWDVNGARIKGRAPPSIHDLVELMQRDDLTFPVPPDPALRDKLVTPESVHKRIETDKEFHYIVESNAVRYRYKVVELHPSYEVIDDDE